MSWPSSCNTRASATMFETTLFPGSSQPMTDHCRGTGPGLWWSIALWAVCVLDCIVRWGETSQNCTAAWSSFSPSLFLPQLFFPGCQTNTGSEGFPCHSCSFCPLLFSSITCNKSLAPLSLLWHLLPREHKRQLLLKNEPIQKNTTEKRTNQLSLTVAAHPLVHRSRCGIAGQLAGWGHGAGISVCPPHLSSH